MSRSFLLKIRKRISRLRLKFVYWVVEESSGNRSFSVIGNPGGMNPYRRLYLSDEQSTRFKSKFYQGGSGISVSLAKAHGLAVISEMKMSPELEAQTVRVPNFVALSLDLPATIEMCYSTLRNDARFDIRRVKKAGYTYRLSQDPGWATEFYEQYHRVSISRRFGGEGYCMPANEIASLVAESCSGFLKIYLGNDCVAAVVYQVIAGCFYFLRLGWLDGRDELLKNGVVAATYWFSIQQAYLFNCQRVNFGGTPSYLENGVFRYKSKWGCSLSTEFTKGSYRNLLLSPEQPDCYKFLKSYSLIILTRENAFVVLSSKYPERTLVSDAVLKGVKSWYILADIPSESGEDEDTEELPEHLRRWYRKVSINIEKDDVSEMKYATVL